MTQVTEVRDDASDREPAPDRDERYADVDTDHLEDVADGCGCAEVWEHTSREREGDDEADAGAA